MVVDFLHNDFRIFAAEEEVEELTAVRISKRRLVMNAKDLRGSLLG
jgi:hypothetical protein